MSGGVLIIGGAASDRIMLKARLSTARYQAEGVTDAAAGLMLAARQQPDAVLICLDPPDMTAARLVSTLRAMPATRDRAIIVLASTAPLPADRLAILTAGADALMVGPCETLLMARLRNLLQQQARIAELVRQTAPLLAMGLAEPDGGVLHPAAPPFSLAIVARTAEAGSRLCRSLAPELERAPTLYGPGTALAAAAGTQDAGTGAPDLWLVDADRADGADAALHLMADLRARDMARDAGFCLVHQGDPLVEALALDLGAGDVIPPHTPPAEMAARLGRVVARQRAADRLRGLLHDSLRLAMIDPLTGLYNRRFAQGRLAAIAEGSRRDGRAFAVMIIDLDRFKDVNDRFGHAAGDDVLLGVAQRLAGLIRPGDLLARIGGEEFVIALPDVTMTEAMAVAHRLCHAIDEAPFCLPRGQVLQVTASIGLALSSPVPETAQAVIERADQALLAAKARGRNQVTIWQTAA